MYLIARPTIALAVISIVCAIFAPAIASPVESAGLPRSGQTSPIRGDLSGRWTLYGGIPTGCNGAVHAAIQDKDGSVVIGGDFTVCGDTYARNLARWDGVRWSAVGSDDENGVDGVVRALAVHQSELYVGGLFDSAGTVKAPNLARWDGQQWLEAGGAGGFQPNDAVVALLSHGGHLYVGGGFSEIGTLPANGIARWDGSAWSSLGQGPDNGVGPSGSHVAALVGGPDGIYLGGRFSEAGTTPANNLAFWSGTSFSSIGTGANDGVDGYVHALETGGSTLYVGGSFTTAGTTRVNNIAAWDGSNWQPLASGGQSGVLGSVLTLQWTSRGLYVGGVLERAGAAAVNNAALWTGTHWQPLWDFMFHGDGVNGPVASMTLIDDRIIMGGLFGRCALGTCSNVGRVAVGGPWYPIVDGKGSGFPSPVRSIARLGNDVYIAGSMEEFLGPISGPMARWDGAGWHAFPDSGFEWASWPPAVLALRPWQGDLYVAGAFTGVSGSALNNIARWTGTEWQALGQGIHGVPAALQEDGQRLLVGGWIQAAGEAWADKVASWDGSSWDGFGTSFPPAGSGSVEAVATFGGELHVGGLFAEIAGTKVQNIARFDGTNWRAVGTDPMSYPDGQVTGMKVFGDKLYVAGQFASIGTLAVDGFASWDGSTWRAVRDANGGSLVGTIETMEVHDGMLYIGGDLERAGMLEINGLVAWDGDAWHALPGEAVAGVDGTVLALHSTPLGLEIGGHFGRAGDGVSVNVARWNRLYDPIFANGFD